MRLGEEIKAARERLGEKQGQFGKRLGVTQATVSRWESGRVVITGPARVLVDQLLRDVPPSNHSEQVPQPAQA